MLFCIIPITSYAWYPFYYLGNPSALVAGQLGI
jgi:hypothetical protein